MSYRGRENANKTNCFAELFFIINLELEVRAKWLQWNTDFAKPNVIGIYNIYNIVLYNIYIMAVHVHRNRYGCFEIKINEYVNTIRIYL